MSVSSQLLVLICLCAAFASASASGSATRIWIDTDAACGAGLLKDVDDCLAIALLLGNPNWDVVGISTVFGNASVAKTDQTARRLVADWCDNCVPVFRGARKPGNEATPAAAALAVALEREPLVVFLFGPATNVSAALKTTGTLSHGHQFVAVAGTRVRRYRHRVSRYSPFRLRDLNFTSDPGAFEFLLSGQIDLLLVPFELARQVKFQGRHIDLLGNRFPELAAQSRRWLWVWRLLFGKNGFHPFDAVAVSTLFADKGGLVCSPGEAGVVDQSIDSNRTRAYLYVSTDTARSNVTYCHGIASRYADMLLDQLNESAKGRN